MERKSHLTRHLFGSMVQRIAALPVPAGKVKAVVAGKPGNEEVGDGKVSVKSGTSAAVAGYGVLGRSRTTRLLLEDRHSGVDKTS
jgi:hypothetical protein